MMEGGASAKNIAGTFYKRCGCPDATCMQEVLGSPRGRAILDLLLYVDMILAV
jgi:hypothetical protein